jgi:hypothetical protein
LHNFKGFEPISGGNEGIGVERKGIQHSLIDGWRGGKSEGWRNSNAGCVSKLSGIGGRVDRLGNCCIEACRGATLGGEARRARSTDSCRSCISIVCYA